MARWILKQEKEERASLLKFRDRQLSCQLLQEIKLKGKCLKEKLGRRPVFMEVCGTHTVAFSKTGLRKALEEIVDLRSGPGCPVCVTDQEDIDRMIQLSSLENVVLGTFGDMVRVPGSRTSLEQEKARGAWVKIFYSPSDAVQWALRNPGKQMIFLGIGFETTAPVVALSIREAEDLGVKNYSVYSVHKLVIPALRALLNDKGPGVDGFILPGHVSAVIGRKAFGFLAQEFNIPGVIAGFEPMDLLGALENLIYQMDRGECRIDNEYSRLVREEGNKTAQTVIREFFDTAEGSWRGLGKIPASSLVLQDNLQKYDALKRFPVEISRPFNKEGCRCGEVLTGKIVPTFCGMFGKECTPSRPVGPCMVSSEGACSAYFHYDFRE
ncbi:hydrogenase formation protein HypD [Candidatus Contubernalis alkaliaceticus]|uniref:hydrogenase formation protein HypD n=1 Tax=Candidatus Contubernalis alkaliaceticus TaxID=338645 RepID=UPI001F4BFEE2|nr:hydrogenase formation protein HypD [Candidatus Contubernalis alkalaceticus]UNC92293.1 hydrogenase formation protein HypD [Candidatus Contubernalis alkalaceticus]